MPVVKNTALDVVKDRTESGYKTKNSGETKKQIFWQTAINDQRPKQKIQIKSMIIKGLLGTGANVTAISPKTGIWIGLFRS